MINRSVIYEYINKISKNDIYDFGLRQQIELNKDEIDTIYYYIKNKIEDIIDNPDNILNEIKNKLSNNAYKKIMELYNRYKIFLGKIK